MIDPATALHTIMIVIVVAGISISMVCAIRNLLRGQ